MSIPVSRYGLPRWLTYWLLCLMTALMAVSLATCLRLEEGGSRQIPQAGGITTLNNRSSKAFGAAAPGLTETELRQHVEGDGAFDAIFVTSPATINSGLGPLFNNTACAGCHIKNGRGLPELGQALVRVSLPTTSAVPREVGVVPVPNVGTQVRDQAIYGFQPDAEVVLNWQTQTGQYPDGNPYELRFPSLTLRQSDSEKPIPGNILTSLRIPPPVFGLGLLEMVPASTLEKFADPRDRNQDGISGRVNHVWDPEKEQLVIGRFGLKANSPTLRHQVASAYANDMGIANPLFPDPQGTQDIDEKTLTANTFYVQSLGVPTRTQLDNAMARKGEHLFAEAHCIACHVTTLKTGPAQVNALAHQQIHPYTDLLLHDMGSGLADGRPDFAANGQEWRTTPLWGLGLTQTVLPYSGYLHDGRARTIAEAILWHSGEAEQSKAQFMAMRQPDRQALLAFLNSL